MPGGAAIVMVIMALALAVTIQGWATPSPEQKKKPSAAPKKQTRRRADGCDLAIEPDGSKDKWDRTWRKELSPQTYASLRAGEVDPANLETSEGGIDDTLEEEGIFVCAGCGSELYDNDTRFEAGCGWPCFFTCLPGAVRERHDADGERMELICNACNGHLGHIFRDEGWDLPPPAERHCVNGRSLRFVPGPTSEWESVDPIDNVD